MESKKLSQDQQLQASNTELESERSLCKTLKGDMEEKTQSLQVVQQELDALKEQFMKHADESKNHVKTLSSSLNESKEKIDAKEKVPLIFVIMSNACQCLQVYCIHAYFVHLSKQK